MVEDSLDNKVVTDDDGRHCEYVVAEEGGHQVRFVVHRCRYSIE
jgi:hypothetical protein